jgi:hypothetical protein
LAGAVLLATGGTAQAQPMQAGTITGTYEYSGFSGDGPYLDYFYDISFAGRINVDGRGYQMVGTADQFVYWAKQCYLGTCSDPYLYRPAHVRARSAAGTFAATCDSGGWVGGTPALWTLDCTVTSGPRTGPMRFAFSAVTVSGAPFVGPITDVP